MVEHSRDGQNFEPVSSARGLNRFLDRFSEGEDFYGYYRVYVKDLFGAKGPYSVPRFYRQQDSTNKSDNDGLNADGHRSVFYAD